MAKLKHQRRSPPRRPTDNRTSRVKQQRMNASSQVKLVHWRRNAES
jgi:hypothetical protein